MKNKDLFVAEKMALIAEAAEAVHKFVKEWKQNGGQPSAYIGTIKKYCVTIAGIASDNATAHLRFLENYRNSIAQDCMLGVSPKTKWIASEKEVAVAAREAAIAQEKYEYCRKVLE